MADTTPAGWYPDPAGSGRQRFFDGIRWTDSFAPYSAPAPAPAPASEPPRPPSQGTMKRTRLWLVLGGLAGVIMLIAIWSLVDRGQVGSQQSGPERSLPTAQGPRREADGLFQEVRDGQFAFVVNSTTTGEVPNTPAMGEWVLIAITVTNIGDKPQSFFPQNQKLIDSVGREFAADNLAALALNERAMIFDMNPGFSVKVWVPFDVPPGVDIVKIELHDSAFSRGAIVNI